jgi:hypothetical protein
MEVVNWAQVDAQLPLPTGNNQPGGYVLHKPIAVIGREKALTDHYFTARSNIG